jgi:hypothetical protein
VGLEGRGLVRRIGFSISTWEEYDTLLFSTVFHSASYIDDASGVVVLSCETHV